LIASWVTVVASPADLLSTARVFALTRLRSAVRDHWDTSEFLLIPNIGDHVWTDEAKLRGVVQSRLFNCMRICGFVDTCLINIVLTDSDVDAGELKGRERTNPA
jgi:hypothetical protein